LILGSNINIDRSRLTYPTAVGSGCRVWPGDREELVPVQETLQTVLQY